MIMNAVAETTCKRMGMPAGSWGRGYELTHCIIEEFVKNKTKIPVTMSSLVFPSILYSMFISFT